MAKESSYQKLKRKNKELEDEVWRLRKLIHDSLESGDHSELELIKREVALEMDIEKSIWQGNPTSEKVYGGIYPMMEAAGPAIEVTDENILEAFKELWESIPVNEVWPKHLTLKGFRFRIHEDQTIEMMVGTLLEKEVWTEIDEEQKKHFFNL